MDPESFFNWDAMDDDDLDAYPDSSPFLSANFDHSVFAESIMHHSPFSDLRQGHTSNSYDNDNKLFSSFNDNSHNSREVKQEPDSSLNRGYTTSNSYHSIASNNNNNNNSNINNSNNNGQPFVCPRAVSSYNTSQNQTSSIFQTNTAQQQYQNNRSDRYTNSTPSLQTFARQMYPTTTTSIPSVPATSTINVDIKVEDQPPVEVRTRTPGENRTFSLKAIVSGNFRILEITAVSVKLLYANSKDGDQPRQTILGGTKAVPITDDGVAVFDNLCMTEASTKHAEKEFCLEFYYIHNDGRESTSTRRTNSFYAYSHKKVLTRRKNISLRALSRQFGPMTGGGEYHVVGTPFIKGPALKCVFKTPHGDIEIKYADNNLDRYSETVLFFKLPPYPRTEFVGFPDRDEITVSVQVTNDGRHFSNELPFVYFSGNIDKR